MRPSVSTTNILPEDGDLMFERFTDRARRVVVLAQEESHLLGHNYISVEHLLLGMMAESDGLAAKALKEHDLELESMRVEIEEHLGRGDHDGSGHIPFTSEAKKVLEQGLREALKLGHSYIGTEHLLLGLVENGDAELVLIRLGVVSSSLRLTQLRLLGRDPGALVAQPDKKQLIVDMNALGLQEHLDRVHALRQELGPDNPEYQLGLARFLEMGARRLRKLAAD